MSHALKKELLEVSSKKLDMALKRDQAVTEYSKTKKTMAFREW